ncbi:MAG: hypothetical protein AAGB46_11445 [Verrucomicrobiota bacterium]
MKHLEFRLQPEAVRPILDSVQPLLMSLEDNLATEAVPPEEDEMLVDFWKTDLLNAQRKDVAAIVEVFSDDFLDTGRATLRQENVDHFLRGCSALRLKIRESILSDLDDLDLEKGEVDFDALDLDQKNGYAAYALFASLIELVVYQYEFGAETEMGEGDGEFEDVDEDELDFGDEDDSKDDFWK